MSHFINKMLQKQEAAITFLICSQKQFYELTSSLHLLIPTLTSACDEAVSLEILERHNTSSVLFSFYCLIIPLIHTSQLTAPHYYTASSQCALKIQNLHSQQMKFGNLSVTKCHKHDRRRAHADIYTSQKHFCL